MCGERLRRWPAGRPKYRAGPSVTSARTGALCRLCRWPTTPRKFLLPPGSSAWPAGGSAGRSPLHLAAEGRPRPRTRFCQRDAVLSARCNCSTSARPTTSCKDFLASRRRDAGDGSCRACDAGWSIRGFVRRSDYRHGLPAGCVARLARVRRLPSSIPTIGRAVSAARSARDEQREARRQAWLASQIQVTEEAGGVAGCRCHVHAAGTRPGAQRVGAG